MCIRDRVYSAFPVAGEVAMLHGLLRQLLCPKAARLFYFCRLLYSWHMEAKVCILIYTVSENEHTNILSCISFRKRITKMCIRDRSQEILYID